MFTGLVEGIGRVAALIPEGPGLRLDITPPESLTADGTPQPGDSIAINGCCLTVIALGNGLWSFQAGSETLSRTNLGRLRTGDGVNLERSLRADARLGGHFVQGHVDGVGQIDAIDTEGDWVHMTFRVPEPLTRQMVQKGSVAVDGISLTLVNVTTDRFRIALIPHTLEHTTLGTRHVGDEVNIETDILGKYIEKMLQNVDRG